MPSAAFPCAGDVPDSLSNSAVRVHIFTRLLMRSRLPLRVSWVGHHLCSYKIHVPAKARYNIKNLLCTCGRQVKHFPGMLAVHSHNADFSCRRRGFP